MKVNHNDAIKLLSDGGVIAYPTETTYGLGCDAFNEKALTKLSQLKGRPSQKGYIVLINNLKQLDLLADPISTEQKQRLMQYWPGAYTFVFPTNISLPKALVGQYSTIAIRMTSHPIAKALCQHSPITSTSANISGEPVCIDINEIEVKFGNKLDGLVIGKPGNQPPSQIIDLITNQRYR